MNEVKADMGICDWSSYKGGNKAALVSGPAPPTGQEKTVEKTGTSTEDGRTHKMDSSSLELPELFTSCTIVSLFIHQKLRLKRGRREYSGGEEPLRKVTFKLQLLQKDI